MTVDFVTRGNLTLLKFSWNLLLFSKNDAFSSFSVLWSVFWLDNEPFLTFPDLYISTQIKMKIFSLFTVLILATFSELSDKQIESPSQCCSSPEDQNIARILCDVTVLQLICKMSFDKLTLRSKMLKTNFLGVWRFFKLLDGLKEDSL